MRHNSFENEIPNTDWDLSYPPYACPTLTIEVRGTSRERGI